MGQKVGIGLMILVTIAWTGFGWWKNSPKEGSSCTSCGPVIAILDHSPTTKPYVEQTTGPEYLPVMPRELTAPLH